MGQLTPNISIYIPANGETNYGSSFSSGMVNIDNHDHTGGPTRGKQLGASSIQDGSITGQQLNSNVVDPTGAVIFNGSSPKQLTGRGALNSFGNNSTNGFIAQTGANTVAARTLTVARSGVMTITNTTGGGNPAFDVPLVNSSSDGLDTPTKGHLAISGADAVTWDASKLNLAPASTGTTAITLGGVNVSSHSQIIQLNNTDTVTYTLPVNSTWLFTGSSVADAGIHQSCIVYSQNATLLVKADLDATVSYYSIAGATVIFTNGSGGTRTFQLSVIRLF